MQEYETQDQLDSAFDKLMSLKQDLRAKEKELFRLECKFDEQKEELNSRCIQNLDKDEFMEFFYEVDDVTITLSEIESIEEEIGELEDEILELEGV